MCRVEKIHIVSKINTYLSWNYNKHYKNNFCSYNKQSELNDKSKNTNDINSKDTYDKEFINEFELYNQKGRCFLMADRKCKYCGSEMDLMESEPNYQVWACMNENCNTSLTLDEHYDWEQWDENGKE